MTYEDRVVRASGQNESETSLHQSEEPKTSSPQVPATKTRGIARFYHASRYSIQGLIAAYRSEPAFRYETWLVIVLLPLAVVVAKTGLQFGILFATLCLILIMELINTAIEAVVDRAGMEFNKLAGLAKDLGSAAVMLSLLMTACIWGGMVWDNYFSTLH